MDMFLFILTLVASGVACAMAAISAFYSRRNNVQTLRTDVAEMLDALDKIARDTRSAKMSRVRQAREDAAAAPDAPPQLRSPQAGLPLTETKAQLRARLLNQH